MSFLNSVRERLRAIEQDEQIFIFYACEAGSRVWGFASDDSDYDVRFLYVRPQPWYLTIDLNRRPDVIERPIQGLLDAHGWDLRKALQLCHASNATLFEWLASPTIYLERSDLTERLRSQARRSFSARAAFHHYLNFARNQNKRNRREGQIKRKAYLYIIRSIFACDWILQHESAPPVPFEEVREAAEIQAPVATRIDELIEEKRSASESAWIDPIEVLDEFIQEQFDRLTPLASDLEGQRPPIEPLNRLFADAVKHVASAQWNAFGLGYSF